MERGHAACYRHTDRHARNAPKLVLARCRAANGIGIPSFVPSTKHRFLCSSARPSYSAAYIIPLQNGGLKGGREEEAGEQWDLAVGGAVVIDGQQVLQK